MPDTAIKTACDIIKAVTGKVTRDNTRQNHETLIPISYIHFMLVVLQTWLIVLKQGWEVQPE